MYSIHIFIFRILAILFYLLSQISQTYWLEPQQHYTCTPLMLPQQCAHSHCCTCAYLHCHCHVINIATTTTGRVCHGFGYHHGISVMGMTVSGAVSDFAALWHTVTTLRYPQVSYCYRFFFLPNIFADNTINIPRSFTQHTYCIMPIHPPPWCLCPLIQHSWVCHRHLDIPLLHRWIRHTPWSSHSTIWYHHWALCLPLSFFILTAQMIFLIVCVQQLLWLLIVVIPLIVLSSSHPSSSLCYCTHRCLVAFVPSPMANRSIHLEHNAACGLCAPHCLIFHCCLVAFAPSLPCGLCAFIALWSLHPLSPCGRHTPCHLVYMALVSIFMLSHFSTSCR